MFRRSTDILIRNKQKFFTVYDGLSKHLYPSILLLNDHDVPYFSSDLLVDSKQTPLIFSIRILALHVSALRPWSHAVAYYT